MTLPDPLAALQGPLAYLDPGSGALLVQMLVAGVAGLALFLRLQGRRVLAFFGLRPKHEEPPESGSGSGEV